MPRNNKSGFDYVGFELPPIDLQVLGLVAKEDDRSTGSLLRLIVATWISDDPRAVRHKKVIAAWLRDNPNKSIIDWVSAHGPKSRVRAFLQKQRSKLDAMKIPLDKFEHKKNRKQEV